MALDVSEMLPTKWEPNVKRRFLFKIEGIDVFFVKSAQKPTFTTEEIEIPWMNSTRYVAGKTKINPINVVLYDAIAPSASQQAMEWMRLCTEIVSGRSGYADFYKRDCQIDVVDPVGNVVGRWDLKGVFPTEGNFGDLDMTSNDISEISLTLRMDSCVLQF